MTDIQIRQQLQNQGSLQAFYITEEFRRKTSVHNTSTHWMMGKANITHFQTQRVTSNSVDLSTQTKPKAAPVPASQSNFQIAYQKIDSRNHYQTTYNQISSRKPLQERTTLSQQAKQSSIILGHGHNNYQSVTTSDYSKEALKQAEILKRNSLGDQIKKSNFQYGGKALKSDCPYTTVSSVTYNNKGNPTKIKATLDSAKANDLRTNHFDIGGPTANTKTSVAKASYRPSSAQQMLEARPQVDRALRNDLRATHWGPVSKPQKPGANFCTSNMLNFKWYQPVPVR